MAAQEDTGEHSQAAGSTRQLWAIVPAAGAGRRMQTVEAGGMPKQYLCIDGRSILELTLERLAAIPGLSGIVVVLAPKDSWWPELDISLPVPLVTAVGGQERAHSVLNGLLAIEGSVGGDDWALVHDAVRPCVSLKDIRRLLDLLATGETGGLLAAPVRETLKKVTGEDVVEATVPRENYWLAATPQLFPYGLLRQALERALTDNARVTDEAHAMERQGHRVRIVQGGADNIKITHPEDLLLAEYLLDRQHHD